MNIIELCLSTGRGGLELYAFRTADSLSKNTGNTVIPVLKKDSKIDHYFKEHGDFTIDYLDHGFSHLPLINAFKLAAIIDNNKIDAIHMHWGKDLALAVFSKLFSKRKPVIIYTRQMMITRNKNDLYHKFLYRHIDGLLTITKELEGLCKNFIPSIKDKIETLYYGVNKPDNMLSPSDVSEHRVKNGFSENDFIVGLIGRIEKSKGQHLLIDALHQAKKNNKTIKALIVGHEVNNGYRDSLKQLANKLGVLDNIVFLDFTSQPQQLMQLCDCVTLASVQETFGLVLPEAMRSGIAVIGSNKGGVPEIIDHDETGLLFESNNASSLYRQITYLFDNPEKKSEIAKNGQAKADKLFNTSTHFHEFENILQKKLNNVQ